MIQNNRGTNNRITNPIKLVKHFKIQEGIDEFDQFVEFLKKSAENIALKIPSFFLLNDKNELYQVMASFRNVEEKDLYCKSIMPHLIVKYNAYIYGIISTAWIVAADSDTTKDNIWPSEHPHRIRVMLTQAISFDKNRLMTAKITHEKKKHLILESWKEINDGNIQGRLVDPVINALQQNMNLSSRMN